MILARKYPFKISASSFTYWKKYQNFTKMKVSSFFSYEANEKTSHLRPA